MIKIDGRVFTGKRYRKDIYDMGCEMFIVREKPPTRQFPNGLTIFSHIPIERGNQNV